MARRAGCPRIALDDFYRDGDRDDLPHTLGIVDWDDVRSWDLDAALTALVAAVRDGQVDLPIYRIESNARTGTQHLDLAGSPVVVAEGIFAPDLIAPCRTAGLEVEAVWLDRSRTVTAALRFVRDLREGRKPPWVLVRRGLALWRAEPVQRTCALDAGCLPLPPRAATALITRH